MELSFCIFELLTHGKNDFQMRMVMEHSKFYKYHSYVLSKKSLVQTLLLKQSKSWDVTNAFEPELGRPGQRSRSSTTNNFATAHVDVKEVTVTPRLQCLIIPCVHGLL